MINSLSVIVLLSAEGYVPRGLSEEARPRLVSLLERLVLVLGLVLHHQLAALTHGEGERALDVLGVTQLVHVLPEDLGEV